MKKICISIICIILILIMVALCFIMFNRPINSLFENFDKLGSWKIYNYENSANENVDAKIEIVENGFDGKCIKISTESLNDVRVYKSIKVEPNTNYRLSVMVNAKTSEEGAGAFVSALNCSQGERIRYTNEQWEEVILYITTLENQSKIDFSLGIGGYSLESSGYAYFDNFKIEKIDKIPDGNFPISFIDFISSENKDSVETQDTIFSKFLFITIVIFVIIFALYISNRSDKTQEEKHKLDKIDYIIIFAFTIIGAIISFINLGNNYTATSFWKPSERGEYITVELEEETDVSQIAHYGNIPTGGYYRIMSSLDGKEFSQVCTLGEYTEDSSKNISIDVEKQKLKSPFFQWKFDEINFKCKYIKIEVVEPGWRVNEIAFYKDVDNKLEKLNIKVVDSYFKEDSGSSPYMLFDEQELVPDEYSYMNSTYFDEVYFPRTAYEQLNGWNIYETTHPPFGKILISIGISIFGMNPFGWRFMGTLFGVLLIPLMYLFAIKIFKKRKYACIASFLILFDFMRFSHSRLATIDSFSTFFVLAMYYFMFDYFVINRKDKEEITEKNKLKSFLIEIRPLFLCGLMFGIGIATKWSCMYAGAGLALIFFVTNIAKIVQLRKEKVKVSDWILKKFIPTCLCCIVFFIIIPLIIYVLSYLPYMPSHPYESIFDVVIDNQISMYNFHSNLNDTHPYESKWYTWPFDIRPIWLYKGNTSYDVDKSSTIASFGNPIIWIPATFAIISMIFITFKNKDRKALLLLIAYTFQLIPWMLPNRSTFIYAYFLATPFAILLLVYFIEKLNNHKKIFNILTIIYLLAVLVFFIMFYPVISGMAVSTSYIEFLKFLPTWTF